MKKTVKFTVEVIFKDAPDEFSISQLEDIRRNIEKGIFNQWQDDGLSPDDTNALTMGIKVTPIITK